MEKKNPKLSSLRRKKIISLVSEYWPKLLLAAFCMVVVAGANGAMALMVKPVMDDIFINQNKDSRYCHPYFFLKRRGFVWI